MKSKTWLRGLVVCVPFILSACTVSEQAWLDEQCLRQGHTKGTAAFAACERETKAWVRWTHYRASRPSGP